MSSTPVSPSSHVSNTGRVFPVLGFLASWDAIEPGCLTDWVRLMNDLTEVTLVVKEGEVRFEREEEYLEFEAATGQLGGVGIWGRDLENWKKSNDCQTIGQMQRLSGAAGPHSFHNFHCHHHHHHWYHYHQKYNFCRHIHHHQKIPFRSAYDLANRAESPYGAPLAQKCQLKHQTDQVPSWPKVAILRKFLKTH